MTKSHAFGVAVGKGLFRASCPQPLRGRTKVRPNLFLTSWSNRRVRTKSPVSAVLKQKAHAFGVAVGKGLFRASCPQPLRGRTKVRPNLFLTSWSNRRVRTKSPVSAVLKQKAHAFGVAVGKGLFRASCPQPLRGRTKVRPNSLPANLSNRRVRTKSSVSAA